MKSRFLKPVILLAFVALAGAVVMLLWNAIIPSVVGWGALGYLQAVGLLVLCRVLFGRFAGFRERANVAMRGGRGERGELKERLRCMSREQRRDHIRRCMRDEQ